MCSALKRLAGGALLVALAGPATAHGVVGNRFFPATLVTDDPFAADELALPTITVFNHETDYEFDWSKSLFPGIAVTLGGGYADASPPGGPHSAGWENVSLTPAAELYRNAPHETIITAGFVWDIGGSGSRSVAERTSRYTPELLFGKGFGDLPDRMALLQPFAVTGTLGFRITGAHASSNALEWGGAIEYSLLYLSSNVRDLGLPRVVAQLTPLVECALATPTDMSGGETTGTINPGLIWSGQYTQVAVEAMVPLNAASGKNVGAIAQMHFYLDDIFPDGPGRPLFGAQM